MPNWKELLDVPGFDPAAPPERAIYDKFSSLLDFPDEPARPPESGELPPAPVERPAADLPREFGKINAALARTDWAGADNVEAFNGWLREKGLPEVEPAEFDRLTKRAARAAWEWAPHYAVDPSVFGSPRAKETLLSWYRAAQAVAAAPGPVASPADADLAAQLALGAWSSRFAPQLDVRPMMGQAKLALLAFAQQHLSPRPDPLPTELEGLAKQLASAVRQHFEARAGSHEIPIEQITAGKLLQQYRETLEGLSALRRLQAAGLARSDVEPTPVLIEALSRGEFDPVVLAVPHPRLVEVGAFAGTGERWLAEQLRNVPPEGRLVVGKELATRALAAVENEKALRRSLPEQAALDVLTAPLQGALKAFEVLGDALTALPGIGPVLEATEAKMDEAAKGALRMYGAHQELESLAALDDLPLAKEDREEIREGITNWNRIGERILQQAGLEDALVSRLGARFGSVGRFIGHALHNALASLVFRPAFAIMEADEDAAVVMGSLLAPTAVRAAAPAAAKIPRVREILAWRLASPASSAAFDELMRFATRLPARERGALLRRTLDEVAEVASRLSESPRRLDVARAEVIKTSLQLAKEAHDPLLHAARVLWKSAPDRAFRAMDPAGFITERILGEGAFAAPLRRKIMAEAGTRQFETVERLLHGRQLEPELMRALEIPGAEEAGSVMAWSQTAATSLGNRGALFNYLLAKLNAGLDVRDGLVKALETRLASFAERRSAAQARLGTLALQEAGLEKMGRLLREEYKKLKGPQVRFVPLSSRRLKRAEQELQAARATREELQKQSAAIYHELKTAPAEHVAELKELRKSVLAELKAGRAAYEKLKTTAKQLKERVRPPAIPEDVSARLTELWEKQVQTRLGRLQLRSAARKIREEIDYIDKAAAPLQTAAQEYAQERAALATRLPQIERAARETHMLADDPVGLARAPKLDETLFDLIDEHDALQILKRIPGGGLLVEPGAAVKTLRELTKIPSAPRVYFDWVRARNESQALFPKRQVPVGTGFFGVRRMVRTINDAILSGTWEAHARETELAQLVDEVTDAARKPALRNALEKILSEPGWSPERLQQAAETLLRDFPEIERAQTVALVRRIGQTAAHYGQELYRLGIWDEGQLARHMEKYFPVRYKRVRPPRHDLHLAVAPANIHDELLMDQHQVVGFGPHGSRPYRILYREAGRFREKYFASAKEAREWAAAEFGAAWEKRARLIEPYDYATAEALGLQKSALYARLDALHGLEELITENRALLALKKLTGLVYSPEDAARMPELAEKTREWVKLSGDRYGVLKDHYVHASIINGLHAWRNTAGFLKRLASELEYRSLPGSAAHALIGWASRHLGVQNPALRTLGGALRRIALTSWIVADPRPYVYNIGFNLFTMGLGLGLSPIAGLRALARGLRALRKRDPRIAQMAELGLDAEGAAFASELGRHAPNISEILTDRLSGGRTAELLRRGQDIEFALQRAKLDPELVADLTRELGEIKFRLSKEYGRTIASLQHDLRRTIFASGRAAVRDVLKKGYNLLWNAYGSIDPAMRIGAVLELMDRGVEPAHAVHQVRMFMQNYQDIPPSIANLSREWYGALVPRFAYEFFRLSKNLITKRPLQLLAFSAAMTANNVLQTVANGGRVDDELERQGPLEGLLNIVSTVRVGNWNWRLGQVLGTSTLLIPTGVLRSWALRFREEGHELPYLAISGASRFLLGSIHLNLAIGWGSGLDLFTNKWIEDDTTSATQKLISRLLWTARTLLPPWTPAPRVGVVRHPSYFIEQLESAYKSREGRYLPLWERALNTVGISRARTTEQNWRALVAMSTRLVWELDPGVGVLTGVGPTARKYVEELMAAPEEVRPEILKKVIETLSTPITRVINGKRVAVRRTPDAIKKALEELSHTSIVETFDALPIYCQTFTLMEGVRRGLHLRDPETFLKLVGALYWGPGYEPSTDAGARLLRLASGQLHVPTFNLLRSGNPDVLQRALDYLPENEVRGVPALAALRRALEYRLVRARARP